MRKYLLILMTLFLFSLGADAITLKFNGYIADEANILPANVKNELNETLRDLHKKSGADLVVVTLPSLNGSTVEDTALDIERSYKLGTKDNGMVFLTAPNEGRMRIEMGSRLANGLSLDTIDFIREQDILPYFSNSDYVNGITRGTYILADEIAKFEGVSVVKGGPCPSEYVDSSNKTSTRRRQEDPMPTWYYVIMFIGMMLGTWLRYSLYGYGRSYHRNSFLTYGGFGGSLDCSRHYRKW